MAVTLWLAPVAVSGGWFWWPAPGGWRRARL